MRQIWVLPQDNKQSTTLRQVKVYLQIPTQSYFSITGSFNNSSKKSWNWLYWQFSRIDKNLELNDILSTLVNCRFLWCYLCFISRILFVCYSPACLKWMLVLLLWSTLERLQCYMNKCFLAYSVQLIKTWLTCQFKVKERKPFCWINNNIPFGF